MHYYIDGYNLLFRLMMHAGENLQSQREQIIYDLNRKVTLVKIDVSIVFDSTFQAGERTRTHYNHLEILFTAQGETADEFILDEIKNSTHPRQETVVTSDKKLAWIARRCSAHTESIEEFMGWLDKSYKNRLKQLKKSQAPTPPAEPQPPLPQLPPPSATKSLFSSAGERTNYYEAIFEKRFEEFAEEEEKRRSTKKKKPRPRKPAPPPSKPVSDMERWLKTFEERFRSPNDLNSKY